MPQAATRRTPTLEGSTVLLVIDIQRGGALGAKRSGIGLMAGFSEMVMNAERLVGAARGAGLPVVFVQEVHHPSGVDFGRELDGAEGVHCLEDDGATELWPSLAPRASEHLVRKRRYSAFFGSDLEVLLRGYRAATLVLCGTLTDVCIHYTFADAHQRDFHLKVATDAVVGSSLESHEAALAAMAYLQRDACWSTAELVGTLAQRR